MVLTKNEYFEIFGELINSIDIIKGIENTILLKEYKDVLKKIILYINRILIIHFY